MPKYNPKADEDAKAAGFEDWMKWFTNYYHKWQDDATVTAAALEVPTLESHIVEVAPDTQQRVFKANPYYFKVDSSGQQLPYIDRVHERFLNADLQIAADPERRGRLQGAGQRAAELSRRCKENEAKGGYTVLHAAGSIGPATGLQHHARRSEAARGLSATCGSARRSRTPSTATR